MNEVTVEAVGIGIAALITIVTLIVNSIINWNVLKKTNALQVDYHRISVQLEQNISLLKRAKELAKEYYDVYTDLHLKKTVDEARLAALPSTIVELRAIAHVIGDETLIQLVRLRDDPDRIAAEGIVDFTEALYTRIYQLMANPERKRTKPDVHVSDSNLMVF